MFKRDIHFKKRSAFSSLKHMENLQNLHAQYLLKSFTSLFMLLTSNNFIIYYIITVVQHPLSDHVIRQTPFLHLFSDLVYDLNDNFRSCTRCQTKLNSQSLHLFMQLLFLCSNGCGTLLVSALLVYSTRSPSSRIILVHST